MTNGSIYNCAGRGYLDVSAVGDNIVILNSGTPSLIGGTSGPAPVFASILNRINEERIAVGKSSVGFVNPTLYVNANLRAIIVLQGLHVDLRRRILRSSTT